MSDQSDSTRFEPPTDPAAQGGGEPAAADPTAPAQPASSFDQPFAPLAGSAAPTEQLPVASTEQIPVTPAAPAEPATNAVPAPIAAVPTAGVPATGVPAAAAGVPTSASVASTPASGGWTAGSADNPYGGSGGPIDPTNGGAAGTGGAQSGGGRNRMAMMGLGAAALAAVVFGGGYVAYQQVLGGGGAQPESAFPATAFAFAKVDLDPSGGQKVDAIRFLSKFPKAPAEAKKEDADLRQVIFDQIQKDGGFKGVDYTKDVEPWLGQRFGFAALAGGAEPTPLIALAVTDVDKAKAGLAKLSASEGNTHCAVGEEFALCGEDQAAVDAALKSGQDASLADAKAFKDDLGALGETGIATFWADASKVKDLMKSSAEFGSTDAGALGDQIKGRYFGALRFDGPTLELIGKGVDVADTGVSGDKNGVAALPADTAVAVGLSGGKEYVGKLWTELEKSGLTSMMGDIEGETGLKLPADLQTIFGNSFAVAFAGMDESGEMPKVALVTDSAEADIQAIADKIEALASLPIAIKGADGRTVISLDQAYADAVASGKGLGESDAFKTAVPDAGSASVVLYADIAKLVALSGQDMDEDDRKLADALGSVGISGGAEGTEVNFRARLTTK